MAWIPIGSSSWEYSTTPEIDDPYNADLYTGRHTLGIRINSDNTEIYVFCRMVSRIEGIGYGEFSKSFMDAIVPINNNSLIFSIPENSQYIPLI